MEIVYLWGMESVKATDSLVMRIDSQGIKAIAWSAFDDDSLEVVKCDYPSGVDAKQRLEDAIYGNRDFFLQRDYSRVWCLMGGAKVMAVPEDVDEDEAKTFFHAAFQEQGEFEEFPLLPGSQAKLLTSFAPQEASFLRRTFYNVSLQPSLLPLCKWYMRPELAGRGSRVFVNVRQGGIDVVALKNGRLQLLNAFDCATGDDAVYYVLAVIHTLGFDNDQNTAVMVSGPTEKRSVFMADIKRFWRTVCPVVIPSEMYRLGQAISEVPYEMIVTSLTGG